MRTTFRRCATVLVLLSAGCATMNDAAIDQLMKDYAGAVPGASVIVVRGGEVVFRKSYGLADLEERTRATPDTHYRLASVTKQFTAAAILALAERKQLSLDDSVRRYLPTLPAYAEPITIRHLLTHTSGVIDYEDIMPADLKRQLTDADVLRLLESQTKTEFAPGSAYHYSNTGYAFLALIGERVSGQTFADFLTSAIFYPAGMKTSVAHQEGISTVPARAFGYSREGSGWKRTDQSMTSAVLGDGGIYSSVNELAQWLRALDAGKFAEGMIPRVDTSRAGVRYGFGWRIAEEGGRRVVSHTGETIGFRNALVRFPEERLAVVVLTNRNEGEPYRLALEIAHQSRQQERRMQ